MGKGWAGAAPPDAHCRNKDFRGIMTESRKTQLPLKVLIFLLSSKHSPGEEGVSQLTQADKVETVTPPRHWPTSQPQEVLWQVG